jgi:hypothetical protein
MDNYKIPNTDEAISLLDELGYDTTGLNEISSFLYVKAQDKNVFNGVLHPEQYELISIAKLNDLVVLKRNDVRDATHIDRDGSKWTCVDFEKSTGHWWSGNHWRQSEFSSDLDIQPITQTQDQGLIIGAEAYDLIGKRVEVEAYCELIDGSYEWQDAKHLPACDILNDGFDFRLKPTTLTVNAELPKPSNTTLHNQNYSVTYEFSSREERNAFADKLRGNNS